MATPTAKVKRINPNIAESQKSFQFDLAKTTLGMNKANTTTAYKAKTQKELEASGLSTEDAAAKRKELRAEFSDKAKSVFEAIAPLIEVNCIRYNKKNGGGGLSWKPIVQRVTSIKMTPAQQEQYMASHPELLAKYIANLKSANPEQFQMLLK